MNTFLSFYTANGRMVFLVFCFGCCCTYYISTMHIINSNDFQFNPNAHCENSTMNPFIVCGVGTYLLCNQLALFGVCGFFFVAACRLHDAAAVRKQTNKIDMPKGTKQNATMHKIFSVGFFIFKLN